VPAKNEKNVSKEIRDLATKTVRYVNSSKGQAEIKSALETSSKVVKRLQKERKIESEELHDPMTI
jgi:hypothetical protein